MQLCNVVYQRACDEGIQLIDYSIMIRTLFLTFTSNTLTLLFLIVTLCAYAQQSHVFGCIISLCTCMYVCMYVHVYAYCMFICDQKLAVRGSIA